MTKEECRAKLQEIDEFVNQLELVLHSADPVLAVVNLLIAELKARAAELESVS